MTVAAASPIALGKPRSDLERAEEAFKAGVKARKRDRPVTAARHFEEAFSLLPAEPRERRTAVLFELIDARRKAYEKTGDAGELCASEGVLRRHLEAVPEGAETRDDLRVRELHSEQRVELEQLADSGEAVACVDEWRVEAPPGEPESDAPRKRVRVIPVVDERARRRLVIVGGTLTAVGGAALIVFAAGLGITLTARGVYDRRVASNTELLANDLELRDLRDRSRMGADLAIAGGLIAGAALGVGVTLLVLARPPRERALSVFPTMSLTGRGAGLGLRLRF
ncbi:MAG: hypothetical protein KC636_29220 [Myxococcales bacterium]|nr:hypothetical protein [Myxococcales bacterium]